MKFYIITDVEKFGNEYKVTFDWGKQTAYFTLGDVPVLDFDNYNEYRWYYLTYDGYAFGFSAH
jgi:hypothetical protein